MDKKLQETYRVRWEGDTLDKEKVIRCKSMQEARETFLRKEKIRKERIIIDSDKGTEYFEATESSMEEAKKEEPSSQESLHHSDNFQPILHKLDEIHSTMKAIRWTIAGGFLFIILVISGIIKPGIFG
jgi:hypothetical protein